MVSTEGRRGLACWALNRERMVLAFERRPLAGAAASEGAGASPSLEVGSGSSETSQLGRLFPPDGGPDCDLGLASRSKLRRPDRVSEPSQAEAPDGASLLAGRVIRMSPIRLTEPLADWASVVDFT